MGRRFPPRVGRRHWRGVIVTDATGQETAYVYLEDEPGRRSAAQARRIAINVARSGDPLVGPQIQSAPGTAFITLYRSAMTNVVLHCLFMQQNQRM
jgi:hypothetical protein